MTQLRRIFSIASLVLLAASVVPAFASRVDTAGDEEMLLSPTLQLEIVSELETLLERHYVLDAEVATLTNALEQARMRGMYNAPLPVESFVTSTNRALQQAFPDRHLGLLTPTRYGEMLVMFGGSDEDSDSEPEHKSDHDAPSAGHKPMAHRAPSPGSAERQHSAVAGLHEIAGITRVAEISRDGLNQIGYIAFDRFVGSERAMSVIDRILRTFTESERLIIDVRDCRGGDADVVRFLSSYLFAEPTHLVSTIGARDADGQRQLSERWTTPNDLSAIFSTKPVDILISAKTFSAGESFAFGLLSTGRARLFGETTGGGGHMNDFFPLPGGLGVSISVGRTFDPRSGEGWQATGVEPDVATQPDHAMSTLIQQITTESGKLAALSGDRRQVYDRLQGYTQAWYNADRDAMSAALADDFQASRRSYEGVETRNRQQQLAATTEGAGHQPRVYHNRIISNIDVGDNIATADLVLRATSHRIELRREQGDWKIVRDTYQDKSLTR